MINGTIDGRCCQGRDRRKRRAAPACRRHAGRRPARPRDSDSRCGCTPCPIRRQTRHPGGDGLGSDERRWPPWAGPKEAALADLRGDGEPEEGDRARKQGLRMRQVLPYRAEGTVWTVVMRRPQIGRQRTIIRGSGAAADGGRDQRIEPRTRGRCCRDGSRWDEAGSDDLDQRRQQRQEPGPLPHAARGNGAAHRRCLA